MTVVNSDEVDCPAQQAVSYLLKSNGTADLNHPLIFLTMKSMPYCSMGNTPLPPQPLYGCGARQLSDGYNNL
jgi:hypothetical protein